jgi:integrase
MREYRRCLDSIPPEKAAKRASVTHGSIDDLVLRYFASGDFKREARGVTLSKNRAIIERFRKKYGTLPVAQVEFQHLDKIIRRTREKQIDGTGGDFAAQKLRKELKRLFRYAAKLKWIVTNPVDYVEPISPNNDGHHTWTEQEIHQFQSYWALGTRQRLAMELMLWTAKRVDDARKLGPQHIRRGELISRDSKTQKTNAIPVSTQLRRAIDAMDDKNLCFVVTMHGKPYSQKGLSQAFSKWCDEAGLLHCTAHGLRKAISRRMAESHATNPEMKSVTQHSDDKELATYTREASQKQLAEKTIKMLSEAYADDR